MRKFLLSGLVIALAIGLVGAGVFAYFQDTETSSGNSFAAGTLDLKIRDGTGWGDGVTVAEWTLSGMVPGVSETGTSYIQLMNTGTIAGHHVAIGASYTASEGPPTGDMDTVNQNLSESWDSFASYLEITYFRYSGDGWWIQYQKGVGYTQGANPGVDIELFKPTGWTAADWVISDDGDGILSLYDLKLDPLKNLPPPSVGYTSETTFEMRVRFHQNAGNDFQGDTLNLTVIFTLNQG